MTWMGLLVLTCAYLLGSIPMGLIIGRLFLRLDLRTVGSGNPGATNMYRAKGPVPGVLTLLLDASKGALAIFAATYAAEYDPRLHVFTYQMLVGLACVLGHVFPIWYGFRGGKGVATSAGVVIPLMPTAGLAALLIFILAVARTKYISLGSILAAFAIPAGLAVEKYVLGWDIPWQYVGFTVGLAGMLAWAHRANIYRLQMGTESRFSLRRKSAPEEAHRP